MIHHVPAATHYTYQDLKTGRPALIPLSFQSHLHEDIKGAMLRSEQSGNRVVPYADNLYLEVDLRHATWGVAAIGLAIRVPTPSGFQPFERLFFGTCAVSAISSSEIYASAGNFYLDAVLKNPKANMGSLSEAPADHPWAAGFVYPLAVGQDAKSRYELTERIWAIMATAINHCRMSLAANNDPNPGGDTGAGRPPFGEGF